MVAHRVVGVKSMNKDIPIEMLKAYKSDTKLDYELTTIESLAQKMSDLDFKLIDLRPKGLKLIGLVAPTDL